MITANQVARDQQLSARPSLTTPITNPLEASIIRKTAKHRNRRMQDNGNQVRASMRRGSKAKRLDANGKHRNEDSDQIISQSSQNQLIDTADKAETTGQDQYKTHDQNTDRVEENHFM